MNDQALLLPMPRVKPTLRIDEAARWLGLGRSAAYEAAREYERTGGKSGLPVIRVGSRLLVPTAEVWRRVGLDPNHPVELPEEDADNGPHAPTERKEADR